MAPRFTNSMGGEFIRHPRPDPGRVRNTGAKFVRPAGEPSLAAVIAWGVVLCVGGTLAIVAFIP